MTQNWTLPPKHEIPDGAKAIDQAKVEALREIADQLDELNEHLMSITTLLHKGLSAHG